MELKSILAVNFGLFERFDLKLSDLGLVCIVGRNNDSDSASSNGSGKSTIVKAIAWCLYGESIDGVVGDAVIHAGSTHASVTIEGVHDGERYEVIRERWKGKPQLTIKIEGKPWTTSKGQALIDSIMGMDFVTFRNTVMYGQGDRKRFIDATATDAERKTLLSAILKLDNLPKCAEIAREEVSRIKAEQAAVQSEIRVLDENIYRADHAKAKKSFDEWEEKQVGRARECRQHAKLALETAVDECHRIDSVIENLEKALERVPSVSTVSALERDWETKGNCLKDAHRAYGKATDVEMALSAKISDVAARLHDLAGDKCPVCTGDLESGTPLEYKQTLIRQKLSLLKDLEAQQAVVEALNKDKSELSEQVEKAWELYIKTKERYSEAEGIARQIEYRKADKERIAKDKRAEAKRWVDQAKAILAETNPFGDVLTTMLADIAKWKAEKHVAELCVADHSAQLALNQFWVKGFGTQGLTSFMLDSTMPFLTERANHYLELLSDGDITMCFSTQRELTSKKGAMRDEISITWKIEGAESYPPSGGQLKKMEIATDLALMDLVATRDGNHPGILILDEILDGLDEEGKNRIVLLLNDLRKVRGSIFVISHDSGISESFDQTIRATKTDGQSYVEVLK